MPHVGFRASDDEYAQIKRLASKNHGGNVSKLMRALTLARLELEEIGTEWEIATWSIFDTDSERVRYALTKSRFAEEFFSILSRSNTTNNIKIGRVGDQFTVSINKIGECFTASTKFEQNKMTAISSIVMQLDTLIQAASTRQLMEGIVDGTTY